MKNCAYFANTRDETTWNIIVIYEWSEPVMSLIKMQISVGTHRQQNPSTARYQIVFRIKYFVIPCKNFYSPSV